MNSFAHAKIIATVLLVLLMVSHVVCPVVCSAESAELNSKQISGSDTSVAANGCCSHSHDGTHSQESDHSCVICPCHAPLAAFTAQPVYAPSIVGLEVFETPQHLPEIFLSKFVPPQNQA